MTNSNHHNNVSHNRRENIEKLYKSIENLRFIHTETIRLQHGIKRDYWAPYNPTLFMYVYYCFNTLYSINWQESLKSGVVHYFDEDRDEDESRSSERFKFNKMISFCFYKPETFATEFRDKFIKIITNEFNRDEIFNIINTIRIDQHPLGNINDDTIDIFKNNVKRLLVDRIFNFETIKEISNFIYLIRNNIFHGTKTLEDMLQKEHKAKLLLYSYFIIAINQMLFSYIDYLYRKYTRREVYNSYNTLISILQDRKELTNDSEDQNNYINDSDFGDL